MLDSGSTLEAPGDAGRTIASRPKLMIYKKESNLLIVKRLLKLGLFSLVLDTDTTLGD